MAPVIPIESRICPHPQCPLGMEAKAADMGARIESLEDGEKEKADTLADMVRTHAQINATRLDGLEVRLEAGEKRSSAIDARLDKLMFLMLGTLLTAGAGLVVQVLILAVQHSTHP